MLLLLIYTVASFTQGLTGFGFGVLATPLIALIFSPCEAVGRNALLGMVNCVYTYYLFRKYVDYKHSLKIFFISFIFIPIGAFFLVSVSETIVFLVMGLMVIFITVQTILQHRSKKMAIVNHKFGIVLPMLSGAVAGAFASPGPILAPYMFAKENNVFVAKANLQFIFSLMSIFIIISHIITKTITPTTFRSVLPYVPVVFIFTNVGAKVSHRIKKEVFQKIEYVALLSLGSYLIVKNAITLIFNQ